MNLQHLVYFRTIVESGGFLKAADKLYITPSTLTKAIGSLEKEIAVPLFEKQGRNKVLTRYGEKFYPYVCEALDTVDAGLIAVRKDLEARDGHVSIAGVFTLCTDFLPQTIKEFSDIYPNIQFSVSYELSGTVLDKLAEREVDLGLTGDINAAKVRERGLHAKVIKKEPLVIIVPKDHPLADAQFVDFDRLKNDPVIFYKNADSGLNKILLQFCKAYELTDRHTIEAYDDPTLISMVANGLGIGLVPDLSYLKGADVGVLRFKDNPPFRTLHLVWPEERFITAEAALFRDYILDGIPEDLNA